MSVTWDNGTTMSLGIHYVIYNLLKTILRED